MRHLKNMEDKPDNDFNLRAEFFQRGSGPSLSQSFLTEKAATITSLTIVPSSAECPEELDLEKLLLSFGKLLSLKLFHAFAGKGLQLVSYTHLCKFDTVKILELKNCELENSTSQWPAALKDLSCRDSNLIMFDKWQSSCSTIKLEHCASLGPSITFESCHNLTDLNLNGSSGIVSIAGLPKGLLWLNVGGLKLESLELPVTLFGLNISYCSYLTEINCKVCPDLIKLNAKDCISLQKLDMSGLDWLSELNLSGCKEIKSLILVGCVALPRSNSADTRFEMEGCTKINLIQGPFGTSPKSESAIVLVLDD